MKRFINSLLAVFILLFSFSVKATNYYVNDGSIVSDVYTSAIGNDANSGTVTAPFKTLKKALIVAVAGDFIYVDYGLYLGGAGGTLGIDFGLSVSVDNLTIIGAGMGSTVFQSNKNKGTFLTILANNFSISNLSMHAYGFGSGGSGVGQTITIGNGATAYSGILFSNIQLDQNGGSAGETAVFIKSKTSSTFSGGGASCNTVSSTYSGGFTVSGTNIDVLFDNYVFAFNSGDCFGGTAGGSVRVVGGNSTEHVTIKNCVFSNGVACSSTFNGMDLYLTTGDIKVYDCLFDSSHSAYATGTAVGGSVAINGSPTVYITRSKFTNHSATGGMNGAAIGNKGGALTLDSCFFSGNSANKADDVHSSSGTINANYCQWSEIGQTGGTFTIVNSGNPSVFEGTVTKTNTTASSYTSNPTVPSFSGVCGAVVITPPCTNPLATTIGVITQPTCSTPTGSVALSGLPATGTWTVTESIGNTTITGTGTTATFSGLTAGQTYSFIVSVSGGCVSPASANAILNAAPTVPAAPTGDATQTFCSASNPTVASLTTTSGTSIQWYLASSGGVALAVGTALVDGLHYYATQTVTGCESATRLDVLVAITASPVVPTGDATQTFCSASNPTVASLTTTSGTSIQWYLASSGGVALAVGTALVDGLHYYATQTVTGCESATRLDVLVAITASPVVPTGNATQTFCSASNSTVASLSATGTAIKWYLAATGGLALPTGTALIDATHYFATQTVTGCESDTRYDVLVSITSSPVLIITDPTAVCAPLTIDITLGSVTAGSTGGGALTFWDNNTSTLPQLVTPSALAVSGTYYIQSSIGGCSDIKPVEVLINNCSCPLNLVITDPTPVCSPLTVNLSAPAVTSGSTGGGALTYYSDIACLLPLVSPVISAVGTTIYYIKSDNGTCNDSEAVNVTINASPLVPSGNSPQTFCSGTSPTVADLTTTMGAFIQWYSLSSGGAALIGGSLLTDATHYYATQFDGTCESATRLDVLVNVTPTPIAPVGSTEQSFCSSTNPTVANLVTTSGVAVQWYDAAVAGVLIPGGTALNDATHYYATQTVAGCESLLSLDVLVAVATSPIMPTGDTGQTFCSGSNSTVADLITTSGINIKWYNTLIGGGLLPSITPLVDGAHYYSTQTVGVCESTPRLDVTVTITNSPSAPTGLASQVFCSGSNPTVANLVATGSAIKWYDAANGGAIVTSVTALVDGAHYYSTQTVGVCESTPRLDVTVTITNSPSIPTGLASQVFCSGSNPTVANLAATGSAIKWYDAANGGAIVTSVTALVDGAHYFATQTVGVCESTTRLDVTVTITNSPSAPTGLASQVFCSGSNPTVANLTTLTGLGVKWYDLAVAGSELSGATPLVNGSHYFATQTSNGCESTTRLDVLVIVISEPATPIGNANQHYCQTANATIKDLLPSGISINWYAGEDTGVVLDASQILENNIHYYATQSIGGCESILRLDVTVHISKLELSKVSHVKPFCGKSNGAITVLASNGIGTITYAWNDGSENPSNTEVAAGNYTVTATDSVGCVAEVSYVIDCEKSDIPQIITPDGNGKNDTWVLLLDKKSEVQIFNRWGSIVYTAQPYNDDWSGQTNKGITLGNDFLPSGTYFYIIDNKDGEKPLSGYIELVR